MSDFSDFLDTVRQWLLRPDYDDNLTISFVRMAETTLSQSLKVREMIVRADAVTLNNRVPLPMDWNGAENIRFTDSGKPLLFRTNGDFFGAAKPDCGWYTLEGSEIVFAAPIDQATGLDVTMVYYQYIPTFTDGATWLFKNYFNIYLQSCLAAGALYGQEYDRAQSITGVATSLVDAANLNYKTSKISGSVLTMAKPRRKYG